MSVCPEYPVGAPFPLLPVVPPSAGTSARVLAFFCCAVATPEAAAEAVGTDEKTVRRVMRNYRWMAGRSVFRRYPNGAYGVSPDAVSAAVYQIGFRLRALGPAPSWYPYDRLSWVMRSAPTRN